MGLCDYGDFRMMPSACRLIRPDTQLVYVSCTICNYYSVARIAGQRRSPYVQAREARLGYELLKRKGSRRKFFNRQKNLLIICHQPHPNPDVDKGCVEDVVSHLIDNGIIEETSP